MELEEEYAQYSNVQLNKNRKMNYFNLFEEDCMNQLGMDSHGNQLY